MWAWLALALLAGCGRFAFDPMSGSDANGDGLGSDAAAPLGCNAITRFADDFEDGVDAGDRWSASYAQAGTSYAETGGDLVFTLAPNSASMYTGYKTQRFFDLRGHQASAQITQLPNTGAELGFSIEYDSATYLHLTVKDGNLIAAKVIAGAYTGIRTASYDSAQTYLAIGEQSGQIVFATSSDGAAFTTFAQTPAPFDVSLVRPSMFAGTDAAVPSPGQAKFGSYNGGVAQPESACAAATLVDRFDAGVIAHVWGASYNGACCTQEVTGGTLVLSTDGTDGYTGLRTSAGFDLTDSAVVVTSPSGPGPSTTFYGDVSIVNDSQNLASLNFHATEIIVRVMIGGVADDVTSARQAGENYLRIREASGQLYFEVSSDKAQWRIARQLADPFPLDDVIVTLEGGVFGPATTADSVEFDDVGVP